MIKIGDFTINHGDPVTCKIKSFQIIDARIYIQASDVGFGKVRAWICHNNTECSGDMAPDRFGYKYSWVFRIYENTGETSEDVSRLRPLLPLEVKKNVKIDQELLHFFTKSNIDELIPIFYYKSGIFDEFNEFYLGEGDGCIKLKNDKKSVEIKLSRFIRQAGLKLNDLISKSPNFNDSQMNLKDTVIENIYNLFVSYQKEQSQMIRFLSGKEILDGYSRKNYVDSERGTLTKSCMVDRPDYLKIYTENPNQIQLAAAFIDDKITARCIVWTGTDGKRYSDRVYYQNDWMENLMTDKLRKLGIEPISEQSMKVVQLEKWDFDYYPYADSFYYLDKSTGTLIAIQTNKLNQLRNTNGALG